MKNSFTKHAMPLIPIPGNFFILTYVADGVNDSLKNISHLLFTLDIDLLSQLLPLSDLLAYQLTSVTW